MADLFATAAAQFDAIRQDWASSVVTYRSGTQTVQLNGTVRPSMFTERLFDEGIGAFVTVGKTQVWDWIFKASDIVLGGSVMLPNRGDRIERINGDQSEIYEVSELGGEKHYRYKDESRVMLVLHTKLIDINDV